MKRPDNTEMDRLLRRHARPGGGGARAATDAQMWSETFDRDLQDPVFAVTFRNDVRHTIFVATSSKHGKTGLFKRGERATVRFEFPNWLAPAR